MPTVDPHGATPVVWLYVPGDRPDRFAKAIAASPAIILDLEDAVAADRKNEARQNVCACVQRKSGTTCKIAVRINSLSTLDGLQDVSDLIRATAVPDAFLVPKVEDAAIIRILDELLSTVNASAELFALIESPRGVERVTEIANATPRLTTLMFGAADYAAALGREAGDLDLAFPASMIVNAAASAGLVAIDTPFFILNDAVAFESACRAARRRGFYGKAAIHPTQVEIIDRIFEPTSAELERARTIIARADEGASTVCGQMVDKAMLRWARRLMP